MINLVNEIAKVAAKILDAAFFDREARQGGDTDLDVIVNRCAQEHVIHG